MATVPFCTPCIDSDHGVCQPPCGCRHRDFWYGPETDVIVPQAGTRGRRNWIGRHAPPVIDGPAHLHARYERGAVIWVLSGVSPLCKQPGRCKRIRLTLFEGDGVKTDNKKRKRPKGLHLAAYVCDACMVAEGEQRAHPGAQHVPGICDCKCRNP